MACGRGREPCPTLVAALAGCKIEPAVPIQRPASSAGLDATSERSTIAGMPLETGNCFITIFDEKRQVLPGAIASLTADDAPRVEVADAQGQCLFWMLAPGTWSLKVQMDGYCTLDYPSVVINVGRNTSLEVTLSLAVIDVIVSE